MITDGSKSTGKVQNADDTKLMRMTVNGDNKAFELIYYKFCPVLKKILANNDDKHMSSDDLIQEVFTRLWQQRKNFRGESCFFTYLLGIARHTVKEKIRQSRKISKMHLDIRTDIKRNSQNGLSQPEAELFYKEFVITLQEVISKLTAKEQQALMVSQYPDVPSHKASQKLGCSQKALRSRLKRARKRSQVLLADVLSDELISDTMLPSNNENRR